MMLGDCIKNYFYYNPTTGDILRKVDRGSCYKKGTKAGYINSYGYRDILFKNKHIRACRLAWFLYYSRWPLGNKQIDHINGIRDDDRISNLREVSHRENAQNLTQHRNGKLVGASWYKRKGKWISRIKIEGVLIHLGYYETEEKAHEAYVLKLNEIKEIGEPPVDWKPE